MCSGEFCNNCNCTGCMNNVSGKKYVDTMSSLSPIKITLRSTQTAHDILVLISRQSRNMFPLQLSNEDERQRSIKQCLDRNPNAFKVKWAKLKCVTMDRSSLRHSWSFPRFAFSLCPMPQCHNSLDRTIVSMQQRNSHNSHNFDYKLTSRNAT